MDEALTIKDRLRCRKGFLLFMALLFLAGWLRFYDLGAESLWMDEAVSAKFAKSDVIRIVEISGRDRHNPPLYWVMLHYWVSRFGNGEGPLRALSAIFGIAAVLMMFLVGRQLFDFRTAFISALLCAVSEFQIYYSQEARPYSLLIFLSLCSYFFFIKIIKPDHRRSDYLWYACSSIALGYTHVYGTFIIASQIGYLLVRGHTCHHQKYRFWSTFAFIVVCLLPLALVLGPSTHDIVSQGFWIERPTLLTIAGILAQFAGGRDGSVVLGVLYISLSLLGLLIAATASIRWGRAGYVDAFIKRCRAMAQPFDKNLLLILWLFVPIIIPFIISRISTPILWPRYTIGASPAFYLLAAQGIRVLGARFGSGMVIIILVLTGPGLVNYYREDVKPQWRTAAQLVSKNAKESDLILIRGTILPFKYYYKGNLRVSAIKESALSGDLVLDVRKENQERDRLWLISSGPKNAAAVDSCVNKASTKRRVLLHEKLKGIELYLIDLRGTNDTTAINNSGNLN